MPAKSKKQQRLFALAQALQKGKVSPSKVGGAAKDIAKTVSTKDVKDFASTPTKGLPQKVKKESRDTYKAFGKKTPKKGDCYDANGRYIIDQKIGGKPQGLKLVHGVAILQTDGKPFGHCWLEKGNEVWDFSNGKNIRLPKELYYALGRIPVHGYKLYKYTADEVAKFIVKTGHWGPWESKAPR